MVYLFSVSIVACGFSKMEQFKLVYFVRLSMILAFFKNCYSEVNFMLKAQMWWFQ